LKTWPGAIVDPGGDRFRVLCIEDYTMIVLTRLNGQRIVMNAEKIRYMESTPDTLVCCDNGEKMMVLEPLDEVMRRAIDYARVIRQPVTE
jgi:flagellar protein FlbD